MGTRHVIIIGAGIYGLAAAKTYLQINPEIRLTILDADSSVGGVWSASRIYPGLTADVPVTSFEFSDLEMAEEFGVPRWSDIPGKMMHEYLELYAKRFDILSRCVFDTEVIRVEKHGKGWEVLTKSSSDGLDGKLVFWTCDVLVVAAGLTSKPVFPDIDTSKFRGLVLHSKDLLQRHTDLISDETRAVAVIGGNKSSVEAVNICANAGKEVHWLIREDGAGPGILLNAKLANGKSGQEVSQCRVTTFQSPTIYRYRGWWDRFFLSGRNWLGRRLFRWFWKNITDRGIKDRYEKSENGRLLKPDVPNVFWSSSGVSIAHDSIAKLLDIIDEGKIVHVSRTAIIAMEGKSLLLLNGSSINVDAVVFATGWDPGSNSLFNPIMKTELGLQTPLDSLLTSETNYWKELDAAADKEVLDAYPFLEHPPRIIDRKETMTPFRLLRTIIPPKLASRDDHTIVFLGQVANIRHCFLAEISSLWSIAYLEGLLPNGDLIKDEEAMNKEIALSNAFMKRRYPGRKNSPIAALEIQDWMDVMLKDLGLRIDRNRLMWERNPDRGRSWWGWRPWLIEWFRPYEPKVYKGLVNEFLESLGKGENKNPEQSGWVLFPSYSESASSASVLS